MSVDPFTLSNKDILARTLYGEARGEYQKQNGGLAALIAVGNVVINRLAYPDRFGSTIKEVCLKPFQFSCWNPRDVNYKLIVRKDLFREEIFLRCLEAAEKIEQKVWPDLTQGCDHYHASWLSNRPFWARGIKPRIQIGQHIFFKLGK